MGSARPLACANRRLLTLLLSPHRILRSLSPHSPDSNAGVHAQTHARTHTCMHACIDVSTDPISAARSSSCSSLILTESGFG
jgi:hypothetical protein